MHRNIYLEGALGDKFGHRHRICADTYTDIFKCIESNRPAFKNYVLECVQKNIGFTVQEGSIFKDEDTLRDPIKDEDIIISIVPAGSKGVGKIIAAIVIAYVAIKFGQPQLAGADKIAAAEAAGGTEAALQAAFDGARAASFGSNTKLALLSVSANLGLTGVAEMMAQDPSVDSNESNQYLFTGDADALQEGDPMPILYGELSVPGRPISVEVINGHYQDPTTILDYNNNLTIASEAKA